MSYLLGAAAVVFGIAALLVVVRITRGPTMLDRAIAFDVLVSIAIGGIVVQAAVDGTADAVPLILVATLLGFVGSVSIARFTPGSDDVDDAGDTGAGDTNSGDTGDGAEDDTRTGDRR